MTTNYQRGARAERALAHLLEGNALGALGFDRWELVMRSAGSRGPFDLVAMGHRRVLLISVKSARSIEDAQRLLKTFAFPQMQLPPNCRAVLAVSLRGKHGGWRFKFFGKSNGRKV